MILSTRAKIALARSAQRVVMAGLRLGGKGPVIVARRGGVNWRLDLREGIDFAICVLGAFEPGTVAAYRRMIKPGATVLDIGANIGAHTLPLARTVGPSGRVVAVEPTRYAFERLTDQLSLNPDLAPRVTTRQAMLMASQSTELVDAIPSSWPLSTPEGAHEHHLGVSKSTAGAAVTTADALVAELKLASVDFIKLDVDGYELEVLRGARGILNDHGPTILFEHSPYTLAEKGYEPNDMIALLRDAGYRFSDLHGRAFGDGKDVPEVPVGAGINVIAARSKPI
jgi:FkbM family methyltransferase